MNVFFSDTDPVKAALNLDDKRVCKMILESAQILTSAHYFRSNVYGAYCNWTGIKPTHIHHPIIQRAGTDRTYYRWIFDHFCALCSVYEHIYNKRHSWAHHVRAFKLMEDCIPEYKELLCVPNCTPYYHFRNTVEAYRLCLQYKWLITDKRDPKWTKRPLPNWLSDDIIRLRYEHRYGKSSKKAEAFYCPYPLDDARRKNWLDKYMEGWYTPLERINHALANRNLTSLRSVGCDSYYPTRFDFYTPTTGKCSIPLGHAGHWSIKGNMRPNI